jgi:molybdopterin synthase sulfur carrier subunit
MRSGSDATRTAVDVTIRYWASARAAAGCDSESFTGRRVGDVLEAASATHTGLGAVLVVSTILLDGHPVVASDLLPEPSERLPGQASGRAILEVLPPFAGG